MAEKKPTILNNFLGMGTNANGDSGVFYSEGFYPRVENGQMMMSEAFTSEEIINKDTTDLEDYTGAKAILYLNTLNEAKSYKIMMQGDGKMFAHQDSTGDQITTGITHTLATIADSMADSSYPDIHITNDGNILYSSAYKIGIGYRGIVKTGSSTTTIIDTDGRDFDTLFSSLDTGHNKVTNLKTGIEYTITSTSTDTLTFNASGTSANTEGDEFIVWYDDKFDLFGTTAYPQFSGQVGLTYIRRQIQQYDSYYFLNGNFLGNLATDESTFDDNYKQLPDRHQGICFNINTDKMIISSNKDGYGHLLLWDFYSDNWNNILKTDKVIYDIKSYGNGWVYYSGGSLYYTDGFSKQKLSDLPDKLEISSSPDSGQTFNSILVDDDGVYLALSEAVNYNRIFNGVYYFTLGFGWTFIPFIYERKYYAPYCIYKNNISIGLDRYTNYIDVGGENSYNRITNDSYDNNYFNNNFVYELNLKNKTQIKALELGVVSNLRERVATTEKYCDLYISIWGGKYGYSQLIGGEAVANDEFKVNKSTYANIDVGNQIFSVSDIPLGTGEPTGERVFITSLLEEDATYKLFQVDPIFTRRTDNSASYVLNPTKFTFHKTIKLSELENDILIPVDKHFSDKLFIQVMTRGITNSFPVSITNINIK